MKSSRMLVLGAMLVSVAVILGGADRASAQQGVYVSQAAARLTKLIDDGNKAKFSLQDNSFSIGGGWLKQSTTTWVPLFTVQLTEGKSYRFLAAGDNDAKDVDLEVIDEKGKIVASDTATNAEAIVDYNPTVSGRYLVRIRLYDSVAENNTKVPCVCLGIVMSK